MLEELVVQTLKNLARGRPAFRAKPQATARFRPNSGKPHEHMARPLFTAPGGGESGAPAAQSGRSWGDFQGKGRRQRHEPAGGVRLSRETGFRNAASRRRPERRLLDGGPGRARHARGRGKDPVRQGSRLADGRKARNGGNAGLTGRHGLLRHRDAPQKLLEIRRIDPVHDEQVLKFQALAQLRRIAL